MTIKRSRDDAGTALVEFTWLAIILLVPLVWIVVSVFQVQQGAFALSAAARAAGRAYSLAPDDATGRERARRAAEQVLADQGVEGQRATVSVTCRTPVPGNCLVGRSVITIDVDSAITLPLAPKILGSETAIVDLDASHTVPYGQYVAPGGQEASRP